MKRKVYSIILSVALTLGVVPLQDKAVSDSRAAEKVSSYVIVAKDDVKSANLKQYGNVTDISLDNDIMSAKLTKSAAREMEMDKNVISVESDIQVTACGETKVIKRSDINLEWNKDLIDLPNEVEKPKKEKVKVAVLDSGVDWGNDIELEKSISFVPGEEDMNPLFMDGSGHGNSVAGLIAAKDNGKGITGINPNVAVYSIRVLDDDNNAPVSRIIKGIYYAIDQKVHIINMSFGTPEYSEALKQAVDDANKAGILVVAAAGNTGDEVEYPAAFSNVLAVGSVDSNAQIANSSAKGKKIKVFAPGEKVCSTGEFGDILISSGTSLAAPQVVAAASLIWQKDLKMPKDFVQNLLIESVNHSKSDQYGLLDIDFALKHYNKFKKKYKKNKTIPDLDNDTSIATTTKTGCVKGSWKEDTHEYLVGSGHANVKKGARYPDTVARFKGIDNNPGWHGSYHVNYVAAYIYATRMAEQLGKGSSASSASTVGGLSTAEKNNMLGDVNSINWSSIEMTTNGKKRAFVWGMAIHTAADVFAHSAFVQSGGAWCHLAHGKNNDNDYADHTGKYPERFQAAENVVGKIVAKYDSQNGGGSYVQFKGMSSVGQTFRLKDLSIYANATNSSADLSGLTCFSVSSGPFNYSWKG